MPQNNQYTTSINIIRDENRNLIYHPTPNSIRVVNQIANDFKKGLRSFNIIGTYGTGKSSFLWAFEQSLSLKKHFFDINLVSNPSFKIINFIGEYKSITESFAEYFNVIDNQNKPQHILSEIYNQYHDLGKTRPLLVIVIDELGKFLEYAAQHEPEKELYFIQQLTEFVNNSDYNICLLTALHQNFDGYAFSLSNTQRQEWAKVKGRFREITFNEPVEQLLFLAAEHIDSQIKEENINEVIKKALKITKSTKTFNLDKELAIQAANKLYPLDLLAANILTLCLQRYGQNERSLFSFLESTDHTSLTKVKISSKNPLYNVANVYDYLIFNFYSFINSKNNPDFLAWTSVKSALENIERSFDDNLEDYDKLIKTIGLLALITPKGSILDEDFLTNYSKTCLGIKTPGILIHDLEQKKIILYRNYSNRFILFEGTDLDIQLALNEAGNKVSNIGDVVTLLKKYYQLPPIFAKMYSYENGTPRLFDYSISDKPINNIPLGEVDGFINLIFNENTTLSEVKQKSLLQEEAIIYGFYHTAKRIKEQLFEIEKTQKVIEENKDDKVAWRELQNVLLHHKNLLNHYIIDGHYNGEVTWIFKGQEKNIQNQKEFNKLISQACLTVYTDTPLFKNELVNRHKISASIHSAKKNYFKALINNWGESDLGFSKDKFPPEKTIYLTLLKNNGIDTSSKRVDEITIKTENNFLPLWKCSIDFLESSKISKRKISELSAILNKRPFKLKQGLIDFWIPSFLFITRTEYALFGENGYIPILNEEVLELITKYPDKYELKAFSVDGIKLDIFNSYRLLLNQTTQEEISNDTFIETIRPFLTFYKNLPEYSKNTKRLEKETLAIRNAIANSKDPEQTFFADFPTALGFTLEKLQNSSEELQDYTTKLQDTIRELRTSFDGLINRIEVFIQDEIIGEKVEFEIYKSLLQGRYQKLKKHLLLPKQKTFVQRLDSQLDDKKAWLSSITQALIGNSLEKLKDPEEDILCEKLKSMILEIDSLTKISKSDFSEEKEEIVSIEINSFSDGNSKKLIRLPKSKNAEIKLIEETIRFTLSKDKSANIAALTNILKELLKNE
ncbi:hypothetical protein [Emticicia agri]|uniref:ATP-binding protein n=1 Tax=Emticicia agri TaxID=2492393 RepID=A0A4Q5M4V3_9BACT|nr:hypothetical protein [Emticicia agri]RYU96933.1 hypothetical protein EWM59_05240 [Emticicia agri]